MRGASGCSKSTSYEIYVNKWIRDFLAIEEDLTIIDIFKQVNAPKQRRFTRTRSTNEHCGSVLRDFKR